MKADKIHSTVSPRHLMTLHNPIGLNPYSPRYDVNVLIDWPMLYARRDQGVWLPCALDMLVYPMIKLHTRLICNSNATHWQIDIKEVFPMTISTISLSFFPSRYCNDLRQPCGCGNMRLEEQAWGGA